MIMKNPEIIWPGGPQLGRMQSLWLRNVGWRKEKREFLRFQAPFWGVGIVWQGAGRYREGTHAEWQREEAPFFFYIWPGSVFEYGPDTCWEESYVVFSGERCSEWEACGWLRRNSRLYPLPESTETLRSLHDQILNGVQSMDPVEADRAKFRTGELLCLLNAHHQPTKNLKHLEGIESLARAWRQEPWHSVDFETAANGIGLSYPHFRRQFRKVIGESPYQYLASQRIAYACRRLTESDRSIKEVAAEAGFEYVESFNRLFRNVMEQSPTAYRSSQRNLGRIPTSSGD
jgi:AraC-like DNA-binding protein